MAAVSCLKREVWVGREVARHLLITKKEIEESVEREKLKNLFQKEQHLSEKTDTI